MIRKANEVPKTKTTIAHVVGIVGGFTSLMLSLWSSACAVTPYSVAIIYNKSLK